MELIYVDGGELLEAAQSGKELSESVAERLHASVNSYIGGLEVTRGGQKPSKCHQSPILFKWKAGE